MSSVLLGQVLLAACLCGSFSRAYEIRLVVLTGICSGLVPALDWCYRVVGPPVDLYAQRNWITYSLLFIPVGALLSAAIVFGVRRALESGPAARWRARRAPRYSAGRVLVSRQFELYRDTHIPPVGPPLTFSRLYSFALLGMLGPSLFRILTAEGAAFWWPLVNRPVSLNLLHGFDPFALGFLGSGLAFALLVRDKKPARWGVLALMVYCSIAQLQHNRAENALLTLASERGHAVEAVEILPTWGNLNLKRGLYLQRDGNLHVCAINLPLIGRARFYEGPEVRPLSTVRHLSYLPDQSPVRRQIESFQRAARGFAGVVEIDGRLHASDLRRSQLPNSASARIALALPPRGAPVPPSPRLELLRQNERLPQQRLNFFRMWIGQDLPEQPGS